MNDVQVSMNAPVSRDGRVVGPYEIRVDGVLVGVSFSKRAADSLYQMCTSDDEYAVFLRDSRKA